MHDIDTLKSNASNGSSQPLIRAIKEELLILSGLTSVPSPNSSMLFQSLAIWSTILWIWLFVAAIGVKKINPLKSSESTTSNLLESCKISILYKIDSIFSD